MGNITIGKYIPGNSFIHKLDPRVKLSINIIFIVLVFMTKTFLGLGVMLSISLASFLFSGLPKKQIYKIILPVIFIGFFLFVINSFLFTQGYSGNDRVNYEVPGSGYFWEDIKWWRLTVSDKATFLTLIIMIRIYIMIIITTMLTATTKPMSLTKAIEDLLFPLKLLFIPVHIIAMIISIALRFIPTLLQEAQRIMKAQASRGVDFKNGNTKSKTKSMITLIIPLFVSAFNKAEDLGNAMETRGYDPYEKRTRYRSYPIATRDIIVSLFVLTLIILFSLMRSNIIVTPNWWI